MNQVECLQENLLLIRRCAGWTAAELGDRIGVTRQTINNLESNARDSEGHKKFTLSKTQYLAIRKVLDDEIASSPSDTEMLKSILSILVDHPEKYTEEYKKVVLARANMIAPSILAKSSTREDVSVDWMESLKRGLIGASAVALAAMAPGTAKMVIQKIKDQTEE